MGERRAGDGPMSREAEPSARDYLPPSLLLLSHSGGTYSLLFDSRPWVAVEVGTYIRGERLLARLECCIYVRASCNCCRMKVERAMERYIKVERAGIE